VAEASRIPRRGRRPAQMRTGRATRAGGAARAVPGCLPRAQALPIGAQATARHAIPAPRRLTTRVQPLSAADRRASRDHGRRARAACIDGLRGHRRVARHRRALLTVAAAGGLRATRLGTVAGGGPESTIALLVAAGLAPVAVAGTAEYTTLAAADRTTRSSPCATSLRIWVRPMPPRWPWRPPPCGS
jgi:hypothetical protein